jgi:hypothetical protein
MLGSFRPEIRHPRAAVNQHSLTPGCRKAPPTKFHETAPCIAAIAPRHSIMCEGEWLTRYAATQSETMAEQAGRFSITLICHASCIKYNWGRRTGNRLWVSFGERAGMPRHVSIALIADSYLAVRQRCPRERRGFGIASWDSRFAP